MFTRGRGETADGLDCSQRRPTTMDPQKISRQKLHFWEGELAVMHIFSGEKNLFIGVITEMFLEENDCM